MLFPFLDLKAEYATMKQDIRAAVDKVLESQLFIMGPEVKQLEAEVAAFIGSRFALACASGSDAILLSLMALGVDSGDEVITPPFTGEISWSPLLQRHCLFYPALASFCALAVFRVSPPSYSGGAGC